MTVCGCVVYEYTSVYMCVYMYTWYMSTPEPSPASAGGLGLSGD